MIPRDAEPSEILAAAERADLADLVAWLQWADPNGCHADAGNDATGADPHTRETAIEAVRDMLADDLADEIGGAS